MGAYRDENNPDVTRWRVDIWVDDPRNVGQRVNGGAVVECREDGDWFYIKPASGKETKMPREVAVVLAQEITTRIAPGETVTREPR